MNQWEWQESTCEVLEKLQAIMLDVKSSKDSKMTLLMGEVFRQHLLDVVDVIENATGYEVTGINQWKEK